MADKISIAMCTYNGERYLRDQLASAAQTRPPDKLVVCDDHSTDATSEIVTGFAAAAPFPVRFHVNEQNLGSTKNFERAIRLCEGDLIALSDQDDVWLPEKLRRIEECLRHDPKVGLVFTDAEVVDEDLQPLGYSLWESVGFDDAHRRLVRTGRVLDVLLPGWTVTGATMAFRRIPLNGEPLLSHLLRYLASAGASRFVVCVGYKAEAIESFLSERGSQSWQVTCVNSGDVSMTDRLLDARQHIHGSALICYGETLANVEIAGL